MFDGHNTGTVDRPMPTLVKRWERRAPVVVADAERLGSVVQDILIGHKSVAAASRFLGVDRRTLRRLADGQAGASITRPIYRVLEWECKWVDEASYEAWLKEYGTHEDSYEEWLQEYGSLADELRQAVVASGAEAALTSYRQWLSGELERFGYTVKGSLVNQPRLSKKRTRYWTVAESTAALKRDLSFKSAIIEIHRRPHLRRELRDFERRAKKAGWVSGMARYELALRHAIEPLWDRTPIELGWKELADDERVLIKYLKAAFQKELVLLDRQTDLCRANAPQA